LSDDLSIGFDCKNQELGRMAHYNATSSTAKAFQAVALILMVSVPARAQVVEGPSNEFVETEPEVSTRTEGLSERETVKERPETLERIGDGTKDSQELILQLRRRRMGELEVKGETYRTNEDLLELYRQYMELKSTSDELHEQALPWLNKSPPIDLRRYEQAFKDHGDKAQIITTDMRPVADGKSWEIVRRADLRVAKMFHRPIFVLSARPLQH
jgi:hypothetical protein